MRVLHKLFVVAIALFVSGCLGGGDGLSLNPAETEEPPSKVVVEPEPGVKVAENRGALRGFVRDEGNLSVPGARVSLLNTNHFADSNQTGEFLFVNLTAGEYEVFVQAQGYTSTTQKVVVKNAVVTSLYLFLAPPVDSDLGNRFHLHDFWGERDEVVLMDADVDLLSIKSNGGTVYSGPYASVYNANSNSSDRFKFWIQGNGQDPPIVFPGTKELVVTFSWAQQQATFRKLGLAYNATGGASAGVPKYLPTQTSGTPWVIPIGPRMADDGHRAFSKWRFWVHSPALSAASANTEGPPGVILGPIHVKMVLRRGEVAPEPAHPDFWKGSTQFVVAEKKKCTQTNAITYTSGNRESGATSYHCTITESGRIVPPGATRLRIAFWWAYTGTAATGPLANGSSFDDNYVLTWRTANQHHSYTPLSQYGRANPVYENVAAHHKVWEIPLKPEETDRYYDTITNWIFLPSIKGNENDPESRDGARTREFTITVVAFRDP